MTKTQLFYCVTFAVLGFAIVIWQLGLAVASGLFLILWAHNIEKHHDL